MSDFIPYQDLKTKIRNQIWPNGEAENLVSAHDEMFLEGMNDIQKWVDGQRTDNVNTYAFCTTMFKCGMTIISAPKGYVRRIYTIANGKWCDPVHYDQVGWPEPQLWAHNLLTYTQPLNVGRPSLPMGTFYAEASTDSRFGRSRGGIWAFDSSRNIVIAPWIQSNETVVVEWEGRKNEWADTDLVDGDVLVQKTLKHYVQWAHERDFGCDRESKSDRKLDYDNALADLMHDDRELRAIKRSKISNLERDRTTRELAESDVPEASTGLVLGVIGNYGVASAGTGNVATLVRSWSPSAILTTGNNTTAGDYDVSVGQYYADYIYPYAGAYTSGATGNAFWPVPGILDWDFDGLANYKSFFTLPNNERYYEICLGTVHVFFLDSDWRDPDGSLVTSTQAGWLKAKLLLSTAKWKIVVMFGSPYSSGSVGSDASLQWPFKNWGADLVISGSDKDYERLSVGGLTYINNGLGGSTPTAIGTPATGTQLFYAATNGALKITVEDSLALAFYAHDGTLVDSLTLTK